MHVDEGTWPMSASCSMRSVPVESSLWGDRSWDERVAGVLWRLGPGKSALGVLLGLLLTPAWYAGYGVVVIALYGISGVVADELGIATLPMRPGLLFWAALGGPLYLCGLPWLAFAVLRRRHPFLGVAAGSWMAFCAVPLLCVAFLTVLGWLG